MLFVTAPEIKVHFQLSYHIFEKLASDAGGQAFPIQAASSGIRIFGAFRGII